MGKIFKSILKFIKNIIKKIIKFIKKFWWVIVLVLAIWFAPVILGYLVSSGAPAWLAGSFSWVATTLTPGLHAAGAWVASGATSLFGEGSKWASLSLGTKASLALGASSLLFPEETGELVEGVAEGVVDAGADLVGGIASGLANSGALKWVLWAAGGYVVYKVITKD